MSDEARFEINDIEASDTEVNELNISEDVSEQMRIRMEKLRQLQENRRDPFANVTFDVDAKSADILADYDKYEGKAVSVAGRMMSRRIMGKASFLHIQDISGRIQAYIKKDEIGEDV